MIFASMFAIAAALETLVATRAPLPAAAAATPYTLTLSEDEVVRTHVLSHLTSSPAAFSEMFLAAQHEPGLVIVCGLVSTMDEGEVQDSPFMGVLWGTRPGHMSRFTLTGLGNTPADANATISMCERYGVF